jgi:hypothetical protein
MPKRPTPEQMMQEMVEALPDLSDDVIRQMYDAYQDALAAEGEEEPSGRDEDLFGDDDEEEDDEE